MKTPEALVKGRATFEGGSNMKAKTFALTMAGLIGFAAAAGALAACPGNPSQCPGNPAQCPGAGPAVERPRSPEAFIEGRNQALESILTLKENQKAAFKAYADARVAWTGGHLKKEARDPEKVYDEQTRLEDRAARLKLRADRLADLAAKRAALWKVLDPQQKMALEAFETQGMGVAHHGLQWKDGRRGPGCGCPAGDGPRPEPRPHHRPDAPQRY